MDALDIISVEEVNSWLSLNTDMENQIAVDEIERLIKTAIGWVETYTSYRLYPREVIIQNSKCEQSTSLYPINSISVKTQEGETRTYKTYDTATKKKIVCPFDSVITLNVGFTTADSIPPVFIDAALKMITYLYENRDIYEDQIPSDLKMLINQYRRGLI